MREKVRGSDEDGSDSGICGSPHCCGAKDCVCISNGSIAFTAKSGYWFRSDDDNG